MATTKAKKGAKKAAKKSPAKKRAAAAPKMSAETKRQLAKGRKLSVNVASSGSFGGIMKELERRLIISPGIIGPRGCAPCFSGLDSVVFGQDVMKF